MSDLLKPQHPKRQPPNLGFSLLEMLTVLFIIGAAAALVTPNLPLLLDRLSFAGKRDSLIRDINSLPYDALRYSQDLVLSEASQRTLGATDGFSSDRADRLETRAGQPQSAPPTARLAELTLPDGWKVRIAEPILYRASGFCTGGNISIEVGRLTYDFQLVAPYCQISEQSL